MSNTILSDPAAKAHELQMETVGEKLDKKLAERNDHLRSQVKLLKRMLAGYESAVRDHALRGTMSAEEHQYAVKEYQRTRRELYNHLDKMTPDET